MKRKYIADTLISVSVILSNGQSKRIAFTALSDGRSVYYTEDEDIIKGLRLHYKNGKLFREVPIEPEKPVGPVKKQAGKQATRKSVAKTGKKPEPKEDKVIAGEEPAINKPEETLEEPTDIEEVEETTEEEETEPQYKEVKVSDMADAKDYLAEHFDVVRTKLKTEESIRETGLTYGIVFITPD